MDGIIWCVSLMIHDAARDACRNKKCFEHFVQLREIYIFILWWSCATLNSVFVRKKKAIILNFPDMQHKFAFKLTNSYFVINKKKKNNLNV